MLVVTIEVWPGGDVTRREVIGILTLVNKSEAADIANYDGSIDGRPVRVEGHRREDGAWVLIRKALGE